MSAVILKNLDLMPTLHPKVAEPSSKITHYVVLDVRLPEQTPADSSTPLLNRWSDTALQVSSCVLCVIGIIAFLSWPFFSLMAPALEASFTNVILPLSIMAGGAGLHCLGLSSKTPSISTGIQLGPFKIAY